VKIMIEKELLAVACEQFLGKNVQHVKNVVLQTPPSGGFHDSCCSMSCLQAAGPECWVSCLCKQARGESWLITQAPGSQGRCRQLPPLPALPDVCDKVDYLSSLGKTQIAAVQRDADIGVAEAERDVGIWEAECKKEMLNVKFMADTKIAESKRAFELQKAAFTEEVNIKIVEAQLSFELQNAQEQQKIRQEEIEIEVVECKKQIRVEEKEVIDMEKELMGTVKQPAEAKAYHIQQITEGEKVKQVLLAQAEAEKIHKIREVEASVMETIGMAEAEGLKLKVEVLQQHREAAPLALVLDALPDGRRELCSP
ncbi:FLOT2 protein, partial [Xiphorhynchus elegans]|nr:FLOT2 protein [Xiphorhynchus elegans]